MSGGHFDYLQFRITEIIVEIEEIIEKNGKKRINRDQWESEFHYNYPEDIIEEFKRGIEFLKKGQIYAQRIDWLVSGDDGDDSFRRRLKQDLGELKDVNKDAIEVIQSRIEELEKNKNLKSFNEMMKDDSIIDELNKIKDKLK
jgi:hypothetical protein